MWGIEIQFSDALRTGLMVSGVIFSDGQVYVHEPITDTYGSVEDLIAAHPGCYVRPIGPVVPSDQAIVDLDKEYEKARQRIHGMSDQLEAAYRSDRAELGRYDRLYLKFGYKQAIGRNQRIA